MQRLTDIINNLQIDVILLNETNTKQNAVNLDKIEQKYKVLGREIIIIIDADSISQDTLTNNYLPGSLLTII